MMRGTYGTVEDDDAEDDDVERQLHLSSDGEQRPDESVLVATRKQCE